MNCESFTELLDRHIDGELDSMQERELLDHAAACDECARSLREAELLRQVLAGMNDDVVVPLEAQAAWRRAVKNEDKQKKVHRRLRLASGLAAALVVALGSTYFLTTDRAADQAPTLTILQADSVIAADGEDESANAGDDRQYAAWRKIRTADTKGAYDTLLSLSDEYGGTIRSSEDGAYRVELPAQYLDEFLRASSRIGEELDAEAGESTDGTAVVYIQFIAE